MRGSGGAFGVNRVDSISIKGAIVRVLDLFSNIGGHALGLHAAKKGRSYMRAAQVQGGIRLSPDTVQDEQ